MDVYKVKDEFWVTGAGATVHVESDALAVRELIEHEIGQFFRIEDTEPAGCVRLGRVCATTENRGRDARTDTGRQITLHNGSHDYDLRRAVEYIEPDGTRVIDSYDSGSLYTIDDRARTVGISSTSEHALAKDSRRLVRDQLFVPWFESHGALTYHASAFEVGGYGYLTPGSRGSGKTSVFLAALRAEAVSGRALSCERIVVCAGEPGARPAARACPENISFFPGTLRSVPELARFAPPFDADREWSRPGKLRVAWREVFAALDARAAEGAVPVTTVLFPQYDAAVGGVAADRLDSERARGLLARHQVTAQDANRPNWLGWFREEPSRQLVEDLAGGEVYALRWSEPGAVTRWLERRARGETDR